MAVQMYRFCNMNSGHCQLGRSLERILEEAHLSGELKLSNRKLKDFPKSATKYDLSDTVFADLSRNRFSELPEEITSFAFLETLILYHNTIRQISDMVKGLSSLTYLDLRSNQLSSLPREICFLPIRVLLIANNRLIVLPEELGRMEKLTELDASCNLLTNLPPRMGDLKNLKSLSLRNNQLVYLPREITTLSLISLNVSSNRISSLPIEIRLMTTLVDLNLENNPLTSPPAGLCVRGLVHVFKFLEMQATKDDNKSKSCGIYDGYSTLRRASRSANGTLENNKTKKNPIDSVCIINDGLDKLLSQDVLNVPTRNNTTSLPKPSFLTNMQANGINLPLKNQKPQQLINDIGNYKNCGKSIEQQYQQQQQQQQQNTDSLNSLITNNVNNSTVIFDDGFIMDNNKLEDRNKNLGNIQTYKEYKEALKQQRNQEIANLYKTKVHKNVTDESDNNVISSIHQQQESVVSEKIIGDKLSPEIKLTANCHKNGPYFEEIQITNKKPVQKVTPSRNILSSSNSIPMTTTTLSLTQQTLSTSFTTNLNNDNNLELSFNNDDDNKDSNDYYKYSKPKSPTKCNGMMVSINNTINNTNNSVAINTINSGTKAGNNVKVQPFKSNYRNMNWNQDMVPSGKLSFTMRREFDKQKEETELIAQLRSIIETRLKMNVPEDIASALTDGVILCHLANHVRPRSVASIHVPSPGVPKLTMARCRRNVDNFLEACRKIGVDEELICSCEDVVSSDEIIYNNYLPNPSAVFKTITALINIIEHQQQQYHKGNQLTPATNHHDPHRRHQQQMITTTKTTTTTTSTVTTPIKAVTDDNNYVGNGVIDYNKAENIEEEYDNDDDDDDTFDTSTSTICENDGVSDMIYDEINNEKIKNDAVMHTCINVPRSPSIKKLFKTEKNNDSGIILNEFENKFASNNDENDQNHHSYYNCHTVNTVDHINLFNTENSLKYGEEILNVNNLNIENNEKNFTLMSNNGNESDDVDGNNDDFTKNNIDMNREINTPEKIVTKRIEFFEGNHQKLSTNNNNNNGSNQNNNINNNNIDNNNSHKYENSVIFSICKPHSNIIEKKKKYLSSNYHKQQDSTLFTLFLSCVFLITFLLLIVFPISN